ncbi:MAG: G8 domain-containing protein [Pseudoruegeria sp.]
MNEDEMDMTEVVISDNNAYLMAMGEDSRIEIHAADVEKESWSQLEITANVGDSTITVQETTGWEIGDKIAIASTSDEWSESEEFTILDISEDGKTITLDGDLTYSHRGETLHYENGLTGENALEWDVEIRAEVALLTRNVTIQGDEDSVEDGYGAHTMVMDGAEQHIEGAEYYRVGQVDELGRYPIHWHMLGDAEGQYAKGVSVHESYQKGSTIHGTSNILYEDNVIYNTVGHGVFFEDGSENGNQIINNLVFNTKESQTGLPIPTDAENASSFWIENPNNVFIGNHAAGSESNGFWIIPAATPHGLSAKVDVGDAGLLSDLIFIDNVGHSAGEASDAGSGGTGKILGIDGRLTDDLAFRQSTLEADFASIDGFTAYGGEVWSLTHEMVFTDLAVIGADFFSRHGNYVENAVFDRATVSLYRDGGNQYSDVYATNWTRLLHGDSDHLDTANALNNFTLDDNSYFTFFDDLNEQQVTLDLDGSVTGIVGAFITPDGEGALFRASPDAVQIDGIAGYVSENTIGATEITALDITGSVRVVRSDGEEVTDLPISEDSRRAGDGNSDANYEIYTSTGMERDVAYLLDFEDLPEELILNLTGIRTGESAVYEVPGIAGSFTVTDGATEVLSYDDLLTSGTSAYYVDSNSGSVFIRLVGGESAVDPDRTVTDLLADYRANASITLAITGDNNTVAHGARELSTDLLAAVDAQAPATIAAAPEALEAEEAAGNSDYELVRYESTSDTTVVTEDMARWSDASTWGDAGIPGVDDIVVIGPDQTVVLDQSTLVKGIIVNGGELIIEDGADLTIDLSTDYLLILNGGLFQAGTENDLLDTEFTLTLEGDDPDMDLYVTQILAGDVANTVFADAQVVEAPLTIQTELIGQTGDLVIQQDDASQWHTVTFEQAMDDPIVAASVVTMDGENAVHIRVQNVTETGFEFQLEEWDYLDGYHMEETISWIAVERGEHTLSDGSVIQAGSTGVNSETSGISFDSAFDEGPIVIGQVASENGGDAVTDRISDVDQDGFNVFLQEEEAADYAGKHMIEDFHWIAFEAGTHENFSASSVVANASGTVVNFDDSYNGAVLADIQTFNGSDTASVRISDWANLLIQEEQSKDSEVNHYFEDVGLIQTDELLFA